MIKVLSVIFCALFLNVILKGYSREFAFLVNVAAAALVFVICAQDLSAVVRELGDITQGVSVVSPYITIMLKVLGVSILAQLLADLCRDNGESALAGQTEIAAKIIILVISMPLFTAVIKIVTGLLK